MKHRRLWIAGGLLILAILGSMWACERQSIKIGAVRYERDAIALDFSGGEVPPLETLREFAQLQMLDLRGTGLTAKEYDTLRREFPECQVRWDIPFQGTYYPEDTKELTVQTLDVGDLEALAYFPVLDTIHADDCADYDRILELREDRPDLKVFHQVYLDGTVYPLDTGSLRITGADVQALERVLPYLTEMESVRISDALAASARTLAELREAYPQIDFQWEFLFQDMTLGTQTETLDLSNRAVTVEEMERIIPYLPGLRYVDMCGCGIPSQEMDAMAKRHPEPRFVWTVQVGHCTLRTDATTFMPWKHGHGKGSVIGESLQELKYCTDMICLDLGHMGITDYSFLEYMPKLKYLILADTWGTDFSALASLKELVFLEIFLTNFNQLEVLTGLTNLEDLNIGYTPVSDITPLLEMTWLKHLWMTGSAISTEDKMILWEALPDTVFSTFGISATDGEWRMSDNYKAMRDLLGLSYALG